MSFTENHASKMRQFDALLVTIRAGIQRTKSILSKGKRP